jgi:hypothetical protein
MRFFRPPPDDAPGPPAAAAALPALDEVARRTRRLDLIASVLLGATVAILDMGGAIAKRGFDASDFEIALITSGQSVGLILSFFVAHRAATSPKMPLVFFPELGRSLALGRVYFVTSTFVLCHGAAQMFQNMGTPARVTIYRLNYPSALRGRIVGRNRQLQLVVATLVALGLSLALDWSRGMEELTRLLGPAPISPSAMINYAIPCIALLGLAGTFVFRAVPVREATNGAAVETRSMADTLREFLRVWREDRAFRRYETFFIVFGFANIMTMPLTQIHCVDVLHASYFDLALINVVLVQGVMAATMVFWGRLVDRYPPAGLRGILNLIFAVDLLLLAVSPTIGWVFVGRVCRGIALGGGTLVWMLGSLYYARSKEEAPIYLGIHTVLTGMRWLTAPFVGVLLKKGFDNARPIFFASFVIVVATALLMIAQGGEEVRRPPVDEAPMPAPRTPGA